MERKKSSNVDLKPKKTHYLQIGLICALAIMFLLLIVMRIFSPKDRFATPSIDIPVELQMAQQIKEIILEQKHTAPPEAVSTPPSNLLDVISNTLIVSDDIVVDTVAKAKTDTLKNKLSSKGFETKPEPEVKDSMPLAFVEDKPTFPGGTPALMKFLTLNTKYPPIAKEIGITGTVLISFLVEKDGSLTSMKIVNNIGGGCNEEALRVAMLMPKWIPAKQHGKFIRTQCQIPFFFYLSAN